MDLPDSPPADAARELLSLADQCVKCGLCLPHCPTFAQLRNEADSPRGRIALIQGWAAGDLAMTPRLAGHLDGCLGCRNCERACPSGVDYGRIADTAKALRVARLPEWRRRLGSRLLDMLASAGASGTLARLTRLYRQLGLARLVEITRLGRLATIRPYHRMASALGGCVPGPVVPHEPAAADVDLFVGCMGMAVQGAAMTATLQVAAYLGLRVRIKQTGLCCGAMLRHAGHVEEAAARLSACVQDHDQDQLVGLASACVAELRAHPKLAATEELCAWLDRLTWPETLVPRPLPRRVLVHEPCTHRNQLGGNAAVYRLLARIPDLEVAPLPSGQGCCGAAGTYLLHHPAMAEALLAELLDPLQGAAPDLIVTTNPGCALHLAAGIREAGLDTRVAHPIELIAAALEPRDGTTDRGS